MSATNPIVPEVKSTADTEAAALLRKSASGKPGKPLTSSNGAVAGRVAGTKVSGKGATRTRGGSV